MYSKGLIGLIAGRDALVPAKMFGPFAAAGEPCYLGLRERGVPVDGRLRRRGRRPALGGVLRPAAHPPR